MKYTFYIAMVTLSLGNVKIFKWLKVGQTGNLPRRIKQLEGGYKAEVSVIFTYDFECEEDSVIAENLAKKLFKERKRVEFIRNDRFTPFVPTATELARLRRAFKKNDLWNV